MNGSIAELLSASTSSCSFTSVPPDHENIVLGTTNATWMEIMAWKEEKDKKDEGSFSTDPGLTDVQERDLGLGRLFGWTGEMTTALYEA